MNKAFEILAEQHRPMLLSYVRAMVYGDQHQAEDVVQETLIVAFQRLDSFRQGENFGSWLRGIARNKVLESHRSNKNPRVVADSRILEGMEEVYRTLDAPLLGEETWLERQSRWVRHCVELLSQRLKDAVVRVYENNMSLAQAAAVENASADTIAQRLTRARRLIGDCVQKQSEIES
jgi:RNA polymerase sigma-70 factor (ECF subfamily)